MSEKSDDVKIAVIENELKNVTKSIEALGLQIKEMSLSLESLKNTFVPRTEFDQLSNIVRGVANEGGLVKRVGKLENKFIYYAGVAFILGILILGGWQYFLAKVPSLERTTTTNINTSNK